MLRTTRIQTAAFFPTPSRLDLSFRASRLLSRASWATKFTTADNSREISSLLSLSAAATTSNLRQRVACRFVTSASSSEFSRRNNIKFVRTINKVYLIGPSRIRRSLTAGKSSVSYKMFQRFSAFLEIIHCFFRSTSRRKHSCLRWRRGVCSDKRLVALENPSGESERSFRWLRPLSWQTARKLDLFFSLLQFLPLRLSNANRFLRRASLRTLPRTFPPFDPSNSVSWLHVCLALYV